MRSAHRTQTHTQIITIFAWLFFTGTRNDNRRFWFNINILSHLLACVYNYKKSIRCFGFPFILYFSYFVSIAIISHWFSSKQTGKNQMLTRKKINNVFIMTLGSAENYTVLWLHAIRRCGIERSYRLHIHVE